jgi:hypothetical protein
MEEGASGKTSLFKRPLFYIVSGLVIVVAALLSMYVLLVPHDTIPKNIRSQANFTLFYPGKLPAGWSVDKSSFYADRSDQVVGYRIKGPSGNLGITIQPVPKGFDFNDFYTKRLSYTVQFLTPLGQGAVGTAEGQLIGSLVTTSSWVLTSSNSSNIKSTDIQSIISNLKPATP